MTLQVPFDQFAATAKRVIGGREAYVTRQTAGTLVTASTATARTIVAAITPLTLDAVRSSLKESGMEVYDGAWSAEGLSDLGDCPTSEAYVAAVAYESSDGRPGMWVDAFVDLPSQVQVLRSMYEEFRDTGETTDVSFEEFVRLANANVVVVTPSQIRGYLSLKTAPPSNVP
jgi:hypothetical protein